MTIKEVRGSYPWVVINTQGTICGHFKTLEEAKQYIKNYE